MAAIAWWGSPRRTRLPTQYRWSISGTIPIGPPLAGNCSILTQPLHAEEAGLRYAYLHCWIEEFRSMTYKTRITPLEVLVNHLV
jgi:hypothetical protein